jgi:predicted kinase
MNKNVYVMMGVPGSGKSTWIRNNVPGALVASADHYFEIINVDNR